MKTEKYVWLSCSLTQLQRARVRDLLTAFWLWELTCLFFPTVTNQPVLFPWSLNANCTTRRMRVPSICAIQWGTMKRSLSSLTPDRLRPCCGLAQMELTEVPGRHTISFLSQVSSVVQNQVHITSGGPWVSLNLCAYREEEEDGLVSLVNSMWISSEAKVCTNPVISINLCFPK